MHQAATASIAQQTLLHFANPEFRMCVFSDMWVLWIRFSTLLLSAVRLTVE